eukprot:SAG11_NODE_6120_length_1384_cov_1.382101_1_plen_73_part_00
MEPEEGGASAPGGYNGGQNAEGGADHSGIRIGAGLGVACVSATESVGKFLIGRCSIIIASQPFIIIIITIIH